MHFENLKEEDIDIYDDILSELKRQQENVELIASENIVSRAVLEAQGSILTNTLKDIPTNVIIVDAPILIK